MRQQVADRRHTLQRGPSNRSSAERAWSRPSGRRLVDARCARVRGVLASRRAQRRRPVCPTVGPTSRSRRRTRTTATRIIRAGIFGGYQAASTGDAFTFPRCTGSRVPRLNGISYLSTTRGERRLDALPTWSHRSRPSSGALCAPSPSTVAGLVRHVVKNVLADGANQASAVAAPTIRCSSPGTTSGGLPLCSATPLVTPVQRRAAPDVQNLFVRDTTTNTFQLVEQPRERPAGVDAGGCELRRELHGDLSHVVFDESAALRADAPSAQR